ncbi:MAG: glycosyltransferase, partial [Microcystaceae cyanobacterium]
LFFEKVEGSSQRLFQWIKDDVQLLRSIPLSNTLWGLFKIVWGLIYFIFKIGFDSIKNTVVRKKPSPEVTIKKVQSFTETLAEVLPSLNLTSEDQILIHTFGIEQLEELYYFLQTGDRSSLPTYHLLFRRDTEDSLVKNAKGMGLKLCLKSCYESKLWPDKICFYTDTEDLVRKYNALSPVQVSQVPIPFRQEKLKLEQTPKDFIHLVYLGDARSEKGYQHLPQLVSGLWQDYLRTEKVKFTIQSNYNVQGGEAQILEAKLNLCQYPTSKIKLIEAPMSPDHYYQLLASADIVILPYNPQNYQRTSGVLTESLAAGKPVVVPKNSWLAQQVDETRASIYENPQDLTQDVIRLLEDLPRFSQNAQEFSVNWRSRQSPDYFLECLLKPLVWESKEVIQELMTTDKIITNILVMLDGSLALQGKNLDKLTYFNQCGYQVYGIFYTSETIFNVDALRQQLEH